MEEAMADWHYETRLSHAQIVEAAGAFHSLWGEGRSLDAHIERNLEALERLSFENSLRLVGLTDAKGAIGSCMKWYTFERTLPSAQVPERVLGIGALFTQPSLRGAGLAARLLSESMEQARATGYGMALLFSEIQPEYYEGLGFVRLPCEEFSMETTPVPERDERWEVCGVFSVSEKIREARRDGSQHVLTHSALTLEFLQWWHEIQGQWLEIYRDGEPVGYGAFRQEGTTLRLMHVTLGEFCDGFWRTLLRFARGQGCERVMGWGKREEFSSGLNVGWTTPAGVVPMVCDLRGRSEDLSLRLGELDRF